MTDKIKNINILNPFTIPILIICLIINLPISQSIAQDIIIPGEIQHHAPDEEIIWDWYTYVPEGLIKSEKCHILITASGSESNVEGDKEIVRGEIASKCSRADPLNFVQLGIVIPRPAEPSIYCINFQQEVFYKETDEFFSRPDLKTNLMIDRFIDIMKSEGYNVDSQVYLEGYSNGGSFAAKYSLLHPHRVRAIASGGNGGLIVLPLSEHEGNTLDWQVGINNLEELAGITFDFDSYKKIHQYFYVGELDDGTFISYNNELLTYDQVDFVSEYFGTNDQDRHQNQTNLLKELGCDVTFKIYFDVGHEYTPEMKDDSFAFFAQYIESSTGDDGSGGGGSGGLGCFINSIRNDLI